MDPSGSSTMPVVDVGEKKRRSRNGCLACRRTRVKCDEVHPSCGRCSDREQSCEWPSDPSAPGDTTPARKQRNPRPVFSCDSCRVKKLKCDATQGSICRPCTTRRIACTWAHASGRKGSSSNRPTTSRSRSRSSASPPFRTLPPYDELQSYGDSFAPTLPAEDFVFPSPSGPISASNTAAPAPNPFDPFTQPVPPPSATHVQPQVPAPPGPTLLPSSLPAPPPAPPLTAIAPAHGLSSTSVTSTSQQMRDLLRLYFTTVHNFGFLSFIHEGDFWDRYEHGRIPDTLCQLMAASALRYGSRTPSAEEIALADQWALEAGDRMLGSVFKEFGAVDLMELVLCHHYDFLAGRYSRGWMMAGMAVRMMTFLRLHILDETPHPSPKPFLSLESLRRLAWSVWFLDATLDGGNFGFSTIGDGAITIQLPSDERPFLLHQSVITEPLMPRDTSSQPATLGLAAHLIRSMHARQILADAHSRIQRKLIPRDSITDLVRHTSNEARAILDTLPREMRYSRVQYHAYRDERSMLVHLHVMRNTCERHLAFLKILAVEHGLQYPHDEVEDRQNDGEGSRQERRHMHEIAEARRGLIADAVALSSIMSDALAYGVIFDPQMAMHSYNGIEVLLFQPMRQAMERSEVSIAKPDVAKCLKPLLEVVRGLAGVSELVSLIHPEAVNRMIRMGYVDDLTNDDIMAVLRKVHSLANVDTEFDFNESFWRYELSLTRSSTHHQPAAGSEGQPHPIVAESPNDRLLETNSEVSPNHPGDMNTAPTTDTSASRLAVPNLVSTSGQSVPLPLPTTTTTTTGHEDPLTRLHTFLATNSRRNSFSATNGQNEAGEARGGQSLGLNSIEGVSGFGDGYDFDVGLGFGLGLGDDLSTLLTNGMRAGSGTGLGGGERGNCVAGDAGVGGGTSNNGWPEGLPRQWSFGD